jgi:DNA-binding protein HU-beta
VNKSDVIDRLAERLGDKGVATAAVDGLIDIVSRSLVKGEKVSISGFGTWERVERAARKARNPATGATVRVKKTAVPKFKAGSNLRSVVSGATKLGREPKHEPLLPANISSASVRRRVDAALGAETAAPASVAAKAPAKKAAKAPAGKSASTSAPVKSTTPAKRAAAASARKASTAGRGRTAAAPAPVKSARVATKKVPARRAVATTVDPALVRKWAQENGVAVSARGRISQNIIDQYRAAVA